MLERCRKGLTPAHLDEPFRSRVCCLQPRSRICYLLRVDVSCYQFSNFLAEYWVGKRVFEEQ